MGGIVPLMTLLGGRQPVIQNQAMQPAMPYQSTLGIATGINRPRPTLRSLLTGTPMEALFALLKTPQGMQAARSIPATVAALAPEVSGQMAAVSGPAEKLASLLGKGSWRDLLKGPMNASKLGDFIDNVEDFSRGWITREGKLAQVLKSHEESLVDAYGIPYEVAMSKKAEIADDAGLLRVMSRRTNYGHGPTRPFAELYSEPTDAQIKQLRAIEKQTGEPLDFAITQPVAGKVTRGSGVNQIRATFDKLNNPIDVKKLGNKTTVGALRSGFMLDDGSLVNKTSVDTHASAILRAGKGAIDPDKPWAAAGQQRIARIYMDETMHGNEAYVEFFSPPSDIQLYKLREIEQNLGKPVSFDVVDPKGVSVVSGSGAKSVRRMIDDYTKKLGRSPWPEQ